MKAATLTVEVDIEAPILTRSTAAGNFGVDAPVARNYEGKLYIPFSLIKGKIKESWKSIQILSPNAPDYKVWIGKDPQKVEDDEWTFERGRLYFSDFVCETAQRTDLDGKLPTTIQARISIDGERLAVDDKALMFYEVPFEVGDKATFCGTISFLANEDDEINAVKSQLERALCWTKSVGSGHNVGFGKIIARRIDCQIEDLASHARNNTPQQTTQNTPEQIGYTLSFDEPFCLANGKRIANVFASDDYVKGSVVRGTLASMLASLYGRNYKDGIDNMLIAPFTELASQFNNFRIRHAFPTLEDTRPVQRPLTAVVGGGNLHDVALSKKALLFEGKLDDQVMFLAPSFSTDWKDADYCIAEKGFPTGQYKPQRELRVRTSIDEATRRAKDAALFAYENIIPKLIPNEATSQTTSTAREIKWKGIIDFTGLDQTTRDTVMRQLKALTKEGLFGVGKTKARAHIKFHTDTTSTPKAKHPSSTTAIEDNDGAKYYILTLQSEALMFDPSSLGPTTDGQGLQDAYQDYFNDIAPDTFKLERFFAEQDLAGGYMWQRKLNREQVAYNPFILTKAASVFVLSVLDEEKAKAKIEHWLATGLELASWVEEDHGTSWRDCPYLPEDGFGEIAVNLEFHTNRAASKASPHPVEVLS